MFDVKKAAGALGAFVSGHSLSAIADSSELMAQLRELTMQHEVIFLRDQAVVPPVFQRFAESLGTVMDHPAYSVVKEAPLVQVLESTPQAPSKIEVWHSDMTFTQCPPSFTMLFGDVIPSYGGDTLWASTTAAYDGLSNSMQSLLDGMSAVHDFRHGFAESLAEPGGAERLAASVAANPPIEHPLVRTHPETGRRSLYVNALFTTHIKDVSPLESEHLLNFIYQHIAIPEYTVRLNWQPGTLAIWDNRSTQHKPINDYFPQHRRMLRLTLRGDRPT